MRPLLELGLLAIPIWHARAEAPDDWCATAKQPSSIAICSNPEWRALTDERQNAFDEATARLDPGSQAVLFESQKDWVASSASIAVQIAGSGIAHLRSLFGALPWREREGAQNTLYRSFLGAQNRRGQLYASRASTA